MKNYMAHLLEGGWNIAVRSSNSGKILEDQHTPFIIIPNTWRTWSADPFLFKHDDDVYVFAELFDYITRKGSIGYTKYENGKWSKWKIVISESFHMSYPNIFEINDEIYMIPETSGGHALRLYKAVQFPNRWELVKNIVEDVMWVDTTFFHSKGKIFAITTDVSDENAHKDYLLEFDDAFSLINTQHIDEKKTEFSRSGGNFFTYMDKTIRVSQDCSFHYGGGMIFSHFNEDTVLEGMGEEILHIFPNDIKVSEKHKWTGIHTYNSLEDFEVVDIERKHFNIFGIVSRLCSKF